MKSSCKTLLFLLTFSLVTVPVFAQTSILSKEQSLWFEKRNKTILVRPEKNYPPFVFVSPGSTGRPQGLAVDYIELINKKLGGKIQYFEPASLSGIMNLMKEGRDGVVLAVASNPEREDYLYFTRPFISVPAVIVIRKDSPSRRGGYTLADFSGKRVSVGASYAVESYIKDNYKKVILEEVTDDEVGIQKLLLGEVDAAVMDLASLSFYTSNKALSYVSVGGQTGFNYDLSFATSKNTPEMGAILDAALQSISPQEHSLIKEKWISITDQKSTASAPHFFAENNLLIVGGIIAGAIIFLVGIILIIRAIRRTQLISLLGYRRGGGESTTMLKDQLRELEKASELVEEELEQIKKIEKDIESKIGQK